MIVFVVGGTTYAEAFAVAQMNHSNQGLRIILGSNTILNSERYAYLLLYYAIEYVINVQLV